jgi:5S rRNA maturation endonuclease (ribonuclease M5)
MPPKYSARELSARLWEARGKSPRAGNSPCPPTCPRGEAHKDTAPSCSVQERNGKTLIKCFAGCEQADLIKALIDLDLWEISENEGEKMSPATLTKIGDAPPTFIYEYYSPQGDVIAEHLRWNKADGSKAMAWRRPGHHYKEGLGKDEGGLSLAELPLYGSEELLKPESEGMRILLVEGEKAANKCREVGVEAVVLANGGGGSQKDYKPKVLEMLQDREIWLWRDNDEAGQKWERTLKDKLRPLAKSIQTVQVKLGYKEDAFDYFEKGGELNIWEAPEVRIEYHGPRSIGVTMPTPRGSVTFKFQQISSKRNSFTAEATVIPPHSPIEDENTPIIRSCNLKSSSSISTLAQECRKNWGDEDGVNWPQLCSKAASRCIISAQEQARESSVDFALVKHDPTTFEQWLIDGVIPAQTHTLLFGRGGGLKTILAHDMAMHLVTGTPWLGHHISRPHKVLILDWENDQRIWLKYQARLLKEWEGPLWDRDSFHYLPQTHPLQENVQHISDFCEEHGIDVLICDSCTLAGGGDTNNQEQANQFMSAIQELNRNLGISTINIGHVVKDSFKNSEKRIESTSTMMGASAWMTNHRAAFYIETTELTGESFISAWFQRKANLARAALPFATVTKFDDTLEFNTPAGPISITEGDIYESDSLDLIPLRTRIKHAIIKNYNDPTRIAEYIDATTSSVEKEISRMSAKNLIFNDMINGKTNYRLLN